MFDAHKPDKFAVRIIQKGLTISGREKVLYDGPLPMAPAVGDEIDTRDRDVFRVVQRHIAWDALLSVDVYVERV
jgi:hypothetical protein